MSTYESWAVKDFSAGLIDKVDGNLIPEGAAKDCRNVYCETLGRLKKRGGQLRLDSAHPLPGPVQGLHTYYHETTWFGGDDGHIRLLFAVSDGNFYRWWGDTLGWQTPIMTGLDRDAPMHFALTTPSPPDIEEADDPDAVNVRVTHVTTTGFKVTMYPSLDGLDETNFGLDGGATVTAATTIDGGVTYDVEAALTVGTVYTLTVTLTDYTFNVTGDMIVPTDATTILASVSQVTLKGLKVTLSTAVDGLVVGNFTVSGGVTVDSATTFDTGTTYEIEFAADLSPLVTYTLTIADGVHTFIVTGTEIYVGVPRFSYLVGANGVDRPFKWYPDCGPDSDGSETEHLYDAPPDGRYPILHREKLFMVPKSSPSQLWWSETFEPEQWPPVYYWPVNDGDGDEITCLRSYMGELLVFKRRSIHSLMGNSIEDFKLVEHDHNIGCVGHRAAAQIGSRVYFVHTNGIYEFNGLRVKNLTENHIPRFWSIVNQSSLHKAAAWAWKDRLWFALPYGNNAEHNNIVLMYDPSAGEMGAWWPFDGMNYSCFAEYDHAEVFLKGRRERVTMYAGSSDGPPGHVIAPDPTPIKTIDFEDTLIESYWIGSTFDIGSAEFHKKIKRAFMEKAPAAPVVGAEYILNLDGATGGTFTLGDGTTFTPALDFDVSAAVIEAALEDIYGVNMVTVTADADFIIRFDTSLIDVTFEIGEHSLTA